MRSRKVAVSKRLLPTTSMARNLCCSAALDRVHNVLPVVLRVLVLPHLHHGVKVSLPLQIVAQIAPPLVQQILIHRVLFVNRHIALQLGAAQLACLRRECPPPARAPPRRCSPPYCFPRGRPARLPSVAPAAGAASHIVFAAGLRRVAADRRAPAFPAASCRSLPPLRPTTPGRPHRQLAHPRHCARLGLELHVHLLRVVMRSPDRRRLAPSSSRGRAASRRMRLSESFSFSSVNCAPSSSRPVFTTWVSFGPILGSPVTVTVAIEVVRLGAELHRDSSGGQQAGLSLNFGKASGPKQCPQTFAHVVPFQPLAGFQRDLSSNAGCFRSPLVPSTRTCSTSAAKQLRLPARQRALRYRALLGWSCLLLRLRRLTGRHLICHCRRAAISRRSPSRYRQWTEQSHQQHRPPRPALRALQSGCPTIHSTHRDLLAEEKLTCINPTLIIRLRSAYHEPVPNSIPGYSKALVCQ